MLKISHLTKIYGSKKAVDDLSLHIRPGVIYGFIGHNGAGKTTTLKSCAGILNFEAGDIEIAGVSIKKDPLFCKRQTAFLPDNPDIYGFMTGIQFLNFLADIYGIDAKTRQERIDRYSEMFEIRDSLGQSVTSYSHGMKQKLALIGVLIREPRLVMMDEPFVGLDPIASHLLKELMRDICNRGGAIFFSTHVLEVAQKLCDEVAIIRQGKLIKNGSMEEIAGDEGLESVFLEMEGEAQNV
ncbi:MAG: ABC transporter ATP-binding protein [Clostridia bacterium]|nr:ABC transporter ATP-binding protein [Clostridia bacterium]